MHRGVRRKAWSRDLRARIRRGRTESREFRSSSGATSSERSVGTPDHPMTENPGRYWSHYWGRPLHKIRPRPSSFGDLTLYDRHLQMYQLATMSFVVIEDRTYSTTEASRILGLTTPDYLLRLIRSGAIRAERVAGRWRIEGRDLALRLSRVEKKRSSVSFRDRSEENRAVSRSAFEPRPGTPGYREQVSA
jgi:excisionase family DNA binding protein